MLNTISNKMKAWQAPLTTSQPPPDERTPILGGPAPGGGYGRLDDTLDPDSQRYFQPPPQPDHVPDTGEWFSYRFDTDGPFFAILHQRGFSWTSRTSWTDLLYLTYMKTRAFVANPAFQRLLGITCAVLSSFFLSVGFAIAKAVNDHVDSLALYAWRQTFLVLYSVPMTAYCGKPVYFHWRDYRAWGQLTLRTIFGSLNIYCVFKAITYISLTDATVVSTTAPIFCSILAYFILGERFGITEVVCSVLVIIGVILVSQPAWLFQPQLLAQGDVVQRIIGLLIAAAGAISGAFSTVLMRTMRSMHFSTVQMVYSYLSVLFTWPIVAMLGVGHLPPCSFSKKFALTLIGFTALPMQAFFIIACQREKAGVVSIARASTPVFSFIWQLVIFGRGLDGYSLLGDLIIMASIVGLAVKKVLDKKDGAKTDDSNNQPAKLTGGIGDNNEANRYEPISVANEYTAAGTYGYDSSGGVEATSYNYNNFNSFSANYATNTSTANSHGADESKPAPAAAAVVAPLRYYDDGDGTSDPELTSSMTSSTQSAKDER